MFSLGKLCVLSKQIWWSKNIMISFWFWAILQITDFICRLICRHWSVNYSITICFLVLHYTAFISQLYCTRQNQLFIVSLVLSISTKLQRIADRLKTIMWNQYFWCEHLPNLLSNLLPSKGSGGSQTVLQIIPS